ncbi:MAG: histidine phosphatase family protein [Clostridia bacterium]|nr:histidine phosphatase family protein [Clostridia bacterium]
MLFFYLRHGDPIYDPDSLTELGIEQAEALSKRLSLYGLDKIYSSTSNRAIMTAKPTCEKLGLEPELLDFTNEHYALMELSYFSNNERKWLFQDGNIVNLFSDKEIIELGDKWYEHPKFKEYDYKKGIERIAAESNKFFKELGYERIDGTGKYKVIKPNNQRVALFAHQGFGIAFLSHILNMPYPAFATHFDICHTGMTVIDFSEIDGYSTPKVLTLSSDSHLYREGLSTLYNYYVEF